MAQVQRPLSPHLQVYRWQVSNTLSILHRLTGVVLAVGSAGLVGWLLALASGPGAFQQAAAIVQSIPGQLLLVGWTFAFCYHLCNGIRHLAWDAGYGFDKHTARKSGIAAVACAAVLTAAIWALAL
ncbi:MAG: succinate dehydrogenase, cytochrome b556 subunit [Chromatiales bacterium]|jgi:succinate dehydrogenase / fumarate reductase cytochrome b subunit|nr:succinate dehydrogenase, cytochrome b556 subunit [Chromatiales bacterium]